MADDFAEFISHLTDNARTSLHHATLIAQGYGSPYIGTEHLLLGVMAQGASVGPLIGPHASLSHAHRNSDHPRGGGSSPA